MKTRYATLPIMLPMLVAFAAAPALAQTTGTAPNSTPPKPAATSTNTAPAQQAAAQQGQQTQNDAQFAEDASAGNMAEVKLGELAQQRGETPAVREFGRWMATDHTMAENILQTTAQQAHVQLATAPTSKQQALMTKLQDQHGTQFDRDYIDAMVQDHKETIQKFQNESQSGQNADLKAYAGQMLPALQQHLAEAEDLQKTGARYSAASSSRRYAEQGTTAGDRAVSKLNQQELNRVEKQHP